MKETETIGRERQLRQPDREKQFWSAYDIYIWSLNIRYLLFQIPGKHCPVFKPIQIEYELEYDYTERKHYICLPVHDLLMSLLPVLIVRVCANIWV